MGPKKCAACGIEVEESQVFLSDRGDICAACEIDTETAAHEALEGGLAHPAVIVGLIAGILPFFISFSSDESTVVNGVAVTASSIDYPAVAGGGVAALAGVAFLGIALRANLQKPVKLAVAVVVLALGAVHLLRGFGVF
jgi:hypothetical protein